MGPLLMVLDHEAISLRVCAEVFASPGPIFKELDVDSPWCGASSVLQRRTFGYVLTVDRVPYQLSESNLVRMMWHAQ